MRWLLAFLLALCVGKAEARFPRGAAVNLPSAVTSCNITTGACTGADAGSGLFAAATCDGVADDRAAFNSFNTFAKATTTNTNGLLIELFIPPGKNCHWTTGDVNSNLVMTGIKNGRIMGYGATFSSAAGKGWRLGPASAPGGICQKGLNDAAGCSARINSVSAGATSVTITNTAFCSRFVTGQWAVITGFDLQGIFSSPFGEPPNPHFLDFVQIGSTAGCAGSGVIQLGSALKYGYLSTWPNFSAGSSTGSDKGGPATIYALVSDWGGAVDIRGLTIDYPTDQTIVHGRSVTLTDITMTGAACVIPSQNQTFSMVNSTGASCQIEVDKIIDTLSYSGTTLSRLGFQSSSTNTFNWNGGSLTTDLNGTPKVAHISNLTTPIIRLGPYAYGTPTSADCTNCVFTSQITNFGLQEKGGAGDPGANVFYSVSGGVFSYADTTSAEQERWAIPGTNVTAIGATGPSIPFFQVTGVTQGGGLVNIATTLAGGYPTVPLTSGKSYLQVQAPKWTCTNCSGNAQAIDFSGTPADRPIFSYSARSYTNTTPLVNSNLWGKVTSIKINVTQAYTGATNPMRFNPSAVTVVPAGTTSNWNVNINLRQAGLRTITPAGVTCDTGGGPVGGACAGDGTLTLPDPNTFFSASLNLAKPDGSPTDQPWAMNYEFIMDQGVVP